MIYDSILPYRNMVCTKGENAAIALAGAEAFLGIEIPKETVKSLMRYFTVEKGFEILELASSNP